jgi:hypothetical protein
LPSAAALAPRLAPRSSQRTPPRSRDDRSVSTTRTWSAPALREQPGAWPEPSGRHLTMNSEPSHPRDAHPQPLTATRLRALIINSLAEHREVAACRPVSTIYSDRLAIEVEDRASLLWRVHVFTEARQ